MSTEYGFIHDIGLFQTVGLHSVFLCLPIQYNAFHKMAPETSVDVPLRHSEALGIRCGAFFKPQGTPPRIPGMVQLSCFFSSLRDPLRDLFLRASKDSVRSIEMHTQIIHPAVIWTASFGSSVRTINTYLPFNDHTTLDSKKSQRKNTPLCNHRKHRHKFAVKKILQSADRGRTAIYTIIVDSPVCFPSLWISIPFHPIS